MKDSLLRNHPQLARIARKLEINVYMKVSSATTYGRCQGARSRLCWIDDIKEWLH